MLVELTPPQRALAFAAGFLLTFLLAVALGRFLKRRAGVRVGFLYRLLCIALAVLVPAAVLHVNFVWGSFDLRRDVGVLAAVLGAFFLLAVVDRYVWEQYFEKQRQTEIPQFLRQLAALVVVIVACVAALNLAYGITVPGLLAGSGIVAIVLGFAMQDTLGNIIAGIALHMGRPFKHGDWLRIDQQFAQVMEVNWRSTQLRTNDHIYLDIPNAQIVKNTIVNLNYPTPTYAMRLRVGIDYRVPPNKVKDVLRHAVKNARGILTTPPPKVFLVEFADYSVIYEVKFWMNNHAFYNDACDSIRTMIWYELHRHKITIPFPIRTVQIDRGKGSERQHTVPAALRSALAQNSFFGCLTAGEMERLLGSARLMEFGADEKIIEQGQNGESMFIIASGTARAVVACDGGEKEVGRLKIGDCFGEMSLLTGEARSATVMAQCDCEVLEIGKADFAELVQQNRQMLDRFSELLAQRRLENEGVLAANASKGELLEKQREYSAGFLARLYRFFDL